MKIKNRKDLESLFFSMICIIVSLLLCIEYFVTNYQKLSLKKYSTMSKSNVNKIHISSIQRWLNYIYEKNNIRSSIFKTSYKNDLQLTPKYFNETFFFNDSETFHQLFKMWLTDRMIETPLNVGFVLKPENPCIDRGRNVSILIAITSSASHTESRSAIRETWGSFAKEKGAKVLYFLGLPKNIKYHSRIIDEHIKFQDIVQSSFLDTYANLTVKTISMLKWVSEVCPFVKYVLKADDDMFINIQNIIDMAENRTMSMSILGELAHYWPPVRSVKNKWYTSYQEYPFNLYPDFVFGPSYLLSGDAIKVLYKSSIKMKLFHLEDVYITGFVAEKEKIQRINLPAMFNTLRDLQPCNFKKLFSSHGHTAHDIRRHWMWLTRKHFQCI